MWYQLRLDTVKEEALTFVLEFNKRFKVIKGICGFEISKIEKKPHIHYSYLVEKEIKRSSISSWMSAKKKKGKYSNKAHTDNNKAFMYAVKDGDIIFNNAFSEEQYEELKDKQIEYDKKVKEEKGLSMIDKLFNYVVEKEGIDLNTKEKQELPTKFCILDHIINFYRDCGLLLPNKSQMFQYICTIMSMLPTENNNDVMDMYNDIFPKSESKMSKKLSSVKFNL